jgi:hypothetical protein
MSRIGSLIRGASGAVIRGITACPAEPELTAMSNYVIVFV